MMLITAIFASPVVGVAPGAGTVHAVEVVGDLVREWETAETAQAVCGVDRLKLLEAAWPPRVASLKPLVRCSDCWNMTGRRRPRSELRAVLP